MGVRIFIRNDRTSKTLAEVKTRLPASIVGKGNRTDDVLDLMDAAYTVPYFMAAAGVLGRGVIGPGYEIVQSDLDTEGTQLKKKKIAEFLSYVPDEQKNIKDTFGPLAKFYTTALMFRSFGQAAWEIIRQGSDGRPIGFDLIPGVVKPNIEADGTFKRPAYVQYLRSGNYESKTEYDSPEDIIFFAVPDFSSGVWLTENLSLSDYTLPSEIYSARAFKSLHENRNAPHSGFWYTPETVDDETFDRFVAMIERRYTGSANYGRNPVIMRGEGGFKSISIPREDAPYIEGRDINRKEMSATFGVPSPKYGVGLEDMNQTALKEVRREFYESTLRPAMALLEEAMYLHICKRLFNAPEWKVKFNRPDFTTAVEDASIELRRIQWGQWSPNDARNSRGEADREGGDYHLIPSNMAVQEDMTPGRPEDEPIDDDEGTPSPGEEDEVPGTMPPEKTESITRELKAWRRFALRVAKGRRYRRGFMPDHIPIGMYKFVQGVLDQVGDDSDAINDLFDDVLYALETGLG